MRVLALTAGLVIGAWVGWRLWPRTVAQPARLQTYGNLWRTFPDTGNPTYTISPRSTPNGTH
jgi:hypothetical protein